MQSIVKLLSKHSVKYWLLTIMSYTTGITGFIIMHAMHGIVQALPLIISGIIMIILFALAGVYNDSDDGNHQDKSANLIR